MQKQEKVQYQIRLQGGTFKFWKKDKMVMMMSLAKKRPSARGKIQFSELAPLGQKLYRSRAIGRLLNILYIIKNPIRVFLSLVLNKHVHLKKIKIRKFKSFMSRFFRLLTAEYPDCWFVYKVEWTHKAGFHLHLLGGLHYGPTPAPVLWRHERVIKQMWDKACKQEGRRANTVEMSLAVEEHRGYLTQPSKCGDDILCMQRLHGCRMFGRVNKKNIRYHDVIMDTLSEEKFFELAIALIEHDKGKVFIKYYVTQVCHDYGVIRRLDRKALLHIYETVKKGGDA